MAQIEWNENAQKEVTVRTKGTTAVAFTLSPNTPYQLMDFRFHTTASITASDSMTVTIDHATSASYDTLIYTKNMVSVTDIYRSFDRMRQTSKDEVDFAWANSDSKSWGMEVKYRKVI